LHAMIDAIQSGENFTCQPSSESEELHKKQRFGSPDSKGALVLSLFEAHYLSDAGRLRIIGSRGKSVKLRQLSGKDALKHVVFSDLRKRGYTVKTALKYGADFRVYDRNVALTEHSRWIVVVSHESEKKSWSSFAAACRVAHSSRKRLLFAVVDDEGDISYWEARWLRP